MKEGKPFELTRVYSPGNNLIFYPAFIQLVSYVLKALNLQ